MPDVFEPEELAELRADPYDVLPLTCEIRRKAGATWSAVATGVACYLELIGRGGDPITDAPGGAERAGLARLDVLPTVDLRPGDVAFLAAEGWRFECELVDPVGIVTVSGYGRLEEL